ncbi:hypothetical protein P280DRAFT_553554 [Massarina eburnea CBS 473.64]|uniref:Uncharacterized protein n=1 Tax=Massarina eburnea CBS 473.64 TaxID=1395130 RepID=A0A6A6RK70_9PLEO|nr:hypothetical protein P280DRAFT_553554 [Massarina eburnea CBS 473.64]
MAGKHNVPGRGGGRADRTDNHGPSIGYAKKEPIAFALNTTLDTMRTLRGGENLLNWSQSARRNLALQAGTFSLLIKDDKNEVTEFTAPLLVMVVTSSVIRELIMKNPDATNIEYLETEITMDAAKVITDWTNGITKTRGVYSIPMDTPLMDQLGPNLDIIHAAEVLGMNQYVSRVKDSYMDIVSKRFPSFKDTKFIQHYAQNDAENTLLVALVERMVAITPVDKTKNEPGKFTWSQYRAWSKFGADPQNALLTKAYEAAYDRAQDELNKGKDDAAKAAKKGKQTTDEEKDENDGDEEDVETLRRFVVLPARASSASTSRSSSVAPVPVSSTISAHSRSITPLSVQSSSSSRSASRASKHVPTANPDLDGPNKARELGRLGVPSRAHLAIADTITKIEGMHYGEDIRNWPASERRDLLRGGNVALCVKKPEHEATDDEGTTPHINPEHYDFHTAPKLPLVAVSLFLRAYILDHPECEAVELSPECTDKAIHAICKWAKDVCTMETPSGITMPEFDIMEALEIRAAAKTLDMKEYVTAPITEKCVEHVSARKPTVPDAEIVCRHIHDVNDPVLVALAETAFHYGTTPKDGEDRFTVDEANAWCAVKRDPKYALFMSITRRLQKESDENKKKEADAMAVQEEERKDIMTDASAQAAQEDGGDGMISVDMQGAQDDAGNSVKALSAMATQEEGEDNIEEPAAKVEQENAEDGVEDADAQATQDAEDSVKEPSATVTQEEGESIIEEPLTTAAQEEGGDSVEEPAAKAEQKNAQDIVEDAAAQAEQENFQDSMEDPAVQAAQEEVEVMIEEPASKAVQKEENEEHATEIDPDKAPLHIEPKEKTLTKEQRRRQRRKAAKKAKKDQESKPPDEEVSVGKTEEQDAEVSVPTSEDQDAETVHAAVDESPDLSTETQRSASEVQFNGVADTEVGEQDEEFVDARVEQIDDCEDDEVKKTEICADDVILVRRSPLPLVWMMFLSLLPLLVAIWLGLQLF